MIPLALPDDTASIHAYTPPALVKHEASASTSGPNDHIPSYPAFWPKPSPPNQGDYASREFVDMVDPLGVLESEICKIMWLIAWVMRNEKCEIIIIIFNKRLSIDSKLKRLR